LPLNCFNMNILIQIWKHNLICNNFIISNYLFKIRNNNDANKPKKGPYRISSWPKIQKHAGLLPESKHVRLGITRGRVWSQSTPWRWWGPVWYWRWSSERLWRWWSRAIGPLIVIASLIIVELRWREYRFH